MLNRIYIKKIAIKKSATRGFLDTNKRILKWYQRNLGIWKLSVIFADFLFYQF